MSNRGYNEKLALPTELHNQSELKAYHDRVVNAERNIVAVAGVTGTLKNTVAALSSDVTEIRAYNVNERLELLEKTLVDIRKSIEELSCSCTMQATEVLTAPVDTPVEVPTVDPVEVQVEAPVDTPVKRKGKKSQK